MKYIFVDTDTGTATPGTPVHTTETWPATSNCFNRLSTAIANATVIAETDSVTFYCRGATNDIAVTISDTPAAASITVIGDVTSPVFNNAKYYIKSTGSPSSVFVISRTVSNVTVSNVQIGAAGTVSQSSLNISSASGSPIITIEKCIIESSGTFTAGRAVSANLASSTMVGIIRNNILWGATTGSGRTGILCSGGSSSSTLYFYNNVVQGFAIGVDRRTASGAAHFFKNNAVFNNTDDFAGGGNTVVAYNASDDGDGTNAVTGVTWANVFNDYANNDYTVKAGNALIGTGIGPSSDANVPSVDFIGTARTGTTTDIGASMYVSSGLTITSVTPSSFDDGKTGIVIAGSGFGATQGSSTLTIGAQAQTISGWNDNAITFTCARGGNSVGNAQLTLTKV